MATIILSGVGGSNQLVAPDPPTRWGGCYSLLVVK